jgi:hypothetical protein
VHVVDFDNSMWLPAYMRKLSLALASACALSSLGMIAPVYGAESATLNVKFVGSDCEGCEVSYSSLPDDAPQVKIKNNAATFDFPEGTIDPGYFIISNPKFGFIDAATVTVMQYKGKSAGQKVLRKQAKSAKRARVCWEGSQSVTDSITIRLSMVKDKDVSGKTTQSILSWARPTQDAVGPYSRTSKGRVLINGDVDCS